jgi:hypothetical protein
MRRALIEEALVRSHPPPAYYPQLALVIQDSRTSQLTAPFLLSPDVLSPVAARLLLQCGTR